MMSSYRDGGPMNGRFVWRQLESGRLASRPQRTVGRTVADDSRKAAHIARLREKLKQKAVVYTWDAYTHGLC